MASPSVLGLIAKRLSIKLKHPVTVANNAISEVTIKRPTVKDLKAFDGSSGDFIRMFNLMLCLTGLLAVEMEEIDAEDYMEMTDVVDGFLGGGQPTGKT